MSNPGTVDTAAAPLAPVDAPATISSPSPEAGTGDNAVTSDVISPELLTEDNLDIEEVADSNVDDTESPAPSPAPAPAAAPVVPAPVVAPAAPVADPAAPAPVAPVVPAPVPDPSQPQPVAPQTVEEARAVLRENYTRARIEMETALATTHYKLTDEMTAALNVGDTTQLATLIPKIAAQVHMDAMTSAVAHVMQYMPQMLGNLMESREVETKAQESFFQAWPQLNMANHGQVIQRLGAAYRQANPSASKEDFIRDVGAQATLALKLPVTATAPAPSQPAPFRPAGAGGTGAAPAPRAGLNPFEALAMSEDVNEDD